MTLNGELSALECKPDFKDKMKHSREPLLVSLVIATWYMLTRCCPCRWLVSELKQHTGRIALSTYC